MNKVLLIAHFMDIGQNTNNRFNYIIEKIIEKNINLEVITSSFSHREKIQRHNIKKDNYKLTTIYEPSYKKNVSLKRFYSHYVMSKNLNKYLKNLQKKPDIIYCSVPSLSVAKIAAKYAKRNKIKFIIDVQDIWPEAFKLIFNIPIISDILFYPMYRQANYIYKQADDIVAVSDTYLSRASMVNEKAQNRLSVFLGTELKYFDRYKKIINNDKTDDIIKIIYIGTLGHSYDIISIIDAIVLLKEKNINNIKFILMGDGPLRNKFEEYAKMKNVDCEFTGILDYDKMIEMLCNCNIAVNPIKKGAAQSIINKVGDYAAAGLPVINTQENMEYREIVNKYKIGFNCENGNINEIADKIEILINNKKLMKELGNNNRKLAEERFDREKTYKDIIELIN